MLAFEFFEQLAWAFAQNVDQHVQTTAVSHANDGFLHAIGTTTLNHMIKRGDKGFTTFQRETLLTHIPGMQIALKAFGCG